MRDLAALQAVLDGAHVDPAVWALRPDYRALLLAVDGLAPGTGAAVAEDLLQQAEARARAVLAHDAVEDLPHVAAWREAYRAFGAKPQRTRHSLEQLLRRAPDGLPRVDPLTDLYNAVSVLHQVPLGGEDLDRYAGSPRLVRATGDEPFTTSAGGEPVVERPEPGEVVWRDDAGVTCRRWNWRQATRTRLTPATTSALFVLDALAPLSDDALLTAEDHLCVRLRALGPDVRVARRLLTSTDAQEPT